MAIELLVNGDNYHNVQEFSIEGVSYYFNTRYNKRCGWLIDIYDADNNPYDNDDAEPLLAGLRCMPNGLLTWRYSKNDGLFSGDIYIVDTVGDLADITKDNFGAGKQYRVGYFTEAELEDLDFESFTSYRIS